MQHSNFSPSPARYSLILSTRSNGLLAIAKIVFYALVFGCMVFPHELELYYASLRFMKLYAFDLAILLVLTCFAVLWPQSKLPWRKLKFNKLVAGYLLVGVMASGIGYFTTGNPYQNVLGDFRRSFFYFSAYGIALVLAQSSKQLKHLQLILFTGATAAILKGLFQLCTGAFVVRRTGDAAHILNHLETTFCTLAIYWALANLKSSSERKLPCILIAAAGIVVVVVANFRTCWLALGVGLACTWFITSHGRSKKLVRSTVLAFVLAAMTISIIWFIPVTPNGNRLGDNVAAKANIGALTADQNVQWRINSYKNAIELWRSRPVLGRGLGEVLSFETSTSTGGSMIVTGHRVHNSYVWFLMSTGIIGFSFLFYLHYYYFSHVAKAAARAGDADRITLIAFLSFYAAMMTTAAFDVFLESGPPTIIVSTTMAVTLLEARKITLQKPGCAVPV